jgi:hypothetical protein
LQAEIAGALRFVGDFLKRELKDARHARDRFPSRHAFADKEREDEVVRAELCFPDDIAQAGAAS